MPEQRRSDFVAKDGGVMTDEVGVVTGDLTLQTEVDDQGRVTQRVQYKDADEWYAISGALATLADGQTIDALHASTVAAHSSADHDA
jgi:hypothetical protein